MQEAGDDRDGPSTPPTDAAAAGPDAPTPDAPTPDAPTPDAPTPDAPTPDVGMASPPAAPGTGAASDGAPIRKRRAPRPHPYALEASTPAETRHDPARVTLFWGGLATAMTIVGMVLDRRFNPDPYGAPNLDWVHKWTLIPLFGGLGLLAFGFVRAPWSKRFTMAGWLLFGFYWALTAFDLLYAEGQDYVNFGFAIIGVYFFTYLAYHQWLSLARGVDNAALHFLNVSTFVAAGAYFVIDKVEAVQKWLILAVAGQTNTVLSWFGQAQQKGLVYHADPSAPVTAASEGPASFWYPNTLNTCPEGTRLQDWLNQNGDAVRSYQASHPDVDPIRVPEKAFQQWCSDHSSAFIHTWWDQVRHFAPDHDHLIGTVSIILACTALQSIMLFVGLVMGSNVATKPGDGWMTQWRRQRALGLSGVAATVLGIGLASASAWTVTGLILAAAGVLLVAYLVLPGGPRLKLLHATWVGLLVYLLNLLRNTGIIWFYGQGQTSFWIMHNAVGKGGSLLAMVGIAFLMFRWFPPFFTSLVGVLDLPDRDGPVERTLRIGRRRPAQQAPSAQG